MDTELLTLFCSQTHSQTNKHTLSDIYRRGGNATTAPIPPSALYAPLTLAPQNYEKARVQASERASLQEKHAPPCLALPKYKPLVTPLLLIQRTPLLLIQVHVVVQGVVGVVVAVHAVAAK